MRGDVTYCPLCGFTTNYEWIHECPNCDQTLVILDTIDCNDSFFPKEDIF